MSLVFHVETISTISATVTNTHTPGGGGIEDQNRKESKDEPALEDHLTLCVP